MSSLDLSKITGSPEDTQELLSTVNNCTTLTSIRIGKECIDSSVATSLSNVIRANPHLQLLSFSGSFTPPQNLEGLSKEEDTSKRWLESDTHWKVVPAPGQNYDTEVADVCRQLHHCTSLTSLDLSQSTILVPAASLLAEAIRSCVTLVHLNISSSIGLRDWKTYGDPDPHSLTKRTADVPAANDEIDLLADPQGDEEVRLIVEALQSSKSPLESLDLSDNFIGARGVSQGMRSLLALISASTSLTTLNLVANPFGRRSLGLFADAMRCNTTVTRLEIGGPPTAPERHDLRRLPQLHATLCDLVNASRRMSSTDVVTFLMETNDCGMFGAVPVLAALEAKGAVRVARDQGLAHLACKTNRLELVRSLADAGMSFTRPDAEGEAPLNFALQERLLDIAHFLIDHSDNEALGRPNPYTCRTVLHDAVICNSVEVLSKLINRDLDLNAADVEGNTPLHLAVLLGKKHQDVARFLVENSASTTIRNKDGFTALNLSDAASVPPPSAPISMSRSPSRRGPGGTGSRQTSFLSVKSEMSAADAPASDFPGEVAVVGPDEPARSRDFVRNLCRGLVSRRIPAFLAGDGEINRSMGASAMVFVVSDVSVRSESCQAELAYARARDLPILLVLRDQATLMSAEGRELLLSVPYVPFPPTDDFHQRIGELAIQLRLAVGAKIDHQLRRWSNMSHPTQEPLPLNNSTDSPQNPLHASRLSTSRSPLPFDLPASDSAPASRTASFLRKPHPPPAPSHSFASPLLAIASCMSRPQSRLSDESDLVVFDDPMRAHDASFKDEDISHEAKSDMEKAILEQIISLEIQVAQMALRNNNLQEEVSAAQQQQVQAQAQAAGPIQQRASPLNRMSRRNSASSIAATEVSVFAERKELRKRGRSIEEVRREVMQSGVRAEAEMTILERALVEQVIELEVRLEDASKTTGELEQQLSLLKAIRPATMQFASPPRSASLSSPVPTSTLTSSTPPPHSTSAAPPPVNFVSPGIAPNAIPRPQPQPLTRPSVLPSSSSVPVVAKQLRQPGDVGSLRGSVGSFSAVSSKSQSSAAAVAVTADVRLASSGKLQAVWPPVGLQRDMISPPPAPVASSRPVSVASLPVDEAKSVKGTWPPSQQSSRMTTPSPTKPTPAAVASTSNKGPASQIAKTSSSPVKSPMTVGKLFCFWSQKAAPAAMAAVAPPPQPRPSVAKDEPSGIVRGENGFAKFRSSILPPKGESSTAAAAAPPRMSMSMSERGSSFTRKTPPDGKVPASSAARQFDLKSTKTPLSSSSSSSSQPAPPNASNTRSIAVPNTAFASRGPSPADNKQKDQNKNGGDEEVKAPPSPRKLFSFWSSKAAEVAPNAASKPPPRPSSVSLARADFSKKSSPAITSSVTVPIMPLCERENPVPSPTLTTDSSQTAALAERLSSRASLGPGATWRAPAKLAVLTSSRKGSVPPEPVVPSPTPEPSTDLVEKATSRVEPAVEEPPRRGHPPPAPPAPTQDPVPLPPPPPPLPKEAVPEAAHHRPSALSVPQPTGPGDGQVSRSVSPAISPSSSPSQPGHTRSNTGGFELRGAEGGSGTGSGSWKRMKSPERSITTALHALNPHPHPHTNPMTESKNASAEKSMGNNLLPEENDSLRKSPRSPSLKAVEPDPAPAPAPAGTAPALQESPVPSLSTILSSVEVKVTAPSPVHAAVAPSSQQTTGDTLRTASPSSAPTTLTTGDTAGIMMSHAQVQVPSMLSLDHHATTTTTSTSDIHMSMAVLSEPAPTWEPAPRPVSRRNSTYSSGSKDRMTTVDLNKLAAGAANPSPTSLSASVHTHTRSDSFTNSGITHPIPIPPEASPVPAPSAKGKHDRRGSSKKETPSTPKTFPGPAAASSPMKSPSGEDKPAKIKSGLFWSIKSKFEALTKKQEHDKKPAKSPRKLSKSSKKP